MSDDGLPDVLERAVGDGESGLPVGELAATGTNVTTYACNYAREQGQDDRVQQIRQWAKKVDAVLAAAEDAGDTVYHCEACSYNWFGAESGGTCPKCNRRAPVEDRFSDQ